MCFLMISAKPIGRVNLNGGITYFQCDGFYAVAAS